MKINTSKKTEQLAKQIEKKKENCKDCYANYSGKLPSTNYCWGLIFKAMKKHL